MIIVVVGFAALTSSIFFWDYSIRHSAKKSQVTVVNPPIQATAPVSSAKKSSTSTVPIEKKRDIPVKKSPSRDALPNEHILQFKSTADLQKFLALARKDGVTVLDTIDKLNIVRIRVTDEEVFEKLLSKVPAGTKPSSNYAIRLPETPLPGEPLFDPNGFDYKEFKNRALDWLGVKNNSKWGKGVTIAVLDTGIESHKVFEGRDMISLDLMTGSTSHSGKEQGHGTAVTSLIAGMGTGVAPGASILSIRVLGGDGTGDSFTVARGIMEAVDRGAQIISMSLGSYGDSPILRQAVQYAQQKGVTLVAAVGNDAQNQIIYPARYPGVVAVGGIDAAGRHLEFSNSGSEVMLSAPGYGIYSAWSDNQMVSFSGTSAAVPFVTGAIASILSENSQITAAQAIGLLTQYADDRGTPGLDSQFGYGVLDLNRVQNRNQRGIYDMAIADQYLENPLSVGGTVQFAVVIQNRGTETIFNAHLLISWNGNQQKCFFSNIGVGQSMKQSLPLHASAYDVSKPTTVTSTVSISGNPDSNSSNNQMTSLIQLR